MTICSKADTSTASLMLMIRRILKEHGRLMTDVDSMGAADSLYSAGLTSHASINVMLALESECEVELPDEMLKRQTFDSMATICAALGTLLASA